MTGQKVWLTSDTHFSHRRIVEFTERGRVTTQEEHDEWLIDLWNSQVNAGDVVYLLGDCSFAKNYDDVAAVFARLNGSIHIIKGNHDNRDHLKKLKEQNYIAWWGDYKEIKLAGKHHTCLFHFPITAWHKQHYGSFMAHGHTHSNFQGEGKILDVGIDNAYKYFGRHMLFSEQSVIDFMSQRKLHIADQHRNDKTGDL